jgi:hypothetical protein
MNTIFYPKSYSAAVIRPRKTPDGDEPTVRLSTGTGVAP